MATLDHAEDDPKRVKVSADVKDQTAVVPSAAHRDVMADICSVPSFAAASELLSAPYSCLVMNAHRRHVSLSPMYLNKKRTGIEQELGAELLKFSQCLKGVPLAYDGIRILGQQGHIYDDSGYIHMDIEANFIVFQPGKDHKLLGTVNKLGVGHVGCLVHGCFNASIPKPNLVSLETWRDFGPRVGTDLEFEVNALDANAVGVLLIRGRLDRTRVKELLAMSGRSASIVDADQPETSEMEQKPESTEESVDMPPKKKKKKKKKKKEKRDKVGEKEMELTNTTQELTGTVCEANGNAAGGKKKKKKKDKRVKEEEVVEAPPVEVHGSDSSGYQSDKPSKKRKHETGTALLSGTREEPGPKVKKRKQVTG
ncbi:DNA-directed RNA polymerase I subunit RPA43 [Brachionichthys hirsutus]|uniref:DNA-directed RNA polymerase I subunit RPA43 n=1 Tax=Brachionichthys hirsutus TaxID=412623 RepID=UPI0036051C90